MPFAQHYQETLEELARVCASCGRDPREVKVIAVSKTVDAPAISAAIAAGAHDFGENRPDVLAAKAQYPQAKVAMHPECRPEAVALADMVGSTADIISYIHSTQTEILVATERGVVDKFGPEYPGRLHQLCGETLTCTDMKLTTEASLSAIMEGRGGEEITLSPALLRDARRSLENMLKYGG